MQCLDQFLPLVLDGYDLTVAAYGQSGSGKVHTPIRNRNKNTQS